ncbi:GyrI-like domain-containing protein [uncultured Microscilla sp.]|uniref:AraC family transcriptional regulator n=1 Tax=uncultured Microscilla sp. TaxID=432653 RepID=UPI00262C6B5E|nr:AraC family transcriptional regulator [uncultured Microscilla sp.]
MNADKTRTEYIRRVNFVLDFIENNLEADLSLESLSKKAYYSPYHFHRVFSTIIGENLNQYVNRKRIERIASILLIRSDKSIKELAYIYGFNSESSFSRAFKKYYGISPTRFKSEGKNTLRKIGIELFTTEQYICSTDHIKKWIEMNAQIVITELQEVKLAGIMHIGEFDKASNMFQRLMEWGAKKRVLATSDFKAITIYHDNPNVTQTSKLRFSTCITISEDINADGEVRPINLKKGIYAVGHFEIKAEEIPTAWKNMCVWVIENGYEFRDGDYFEVYHNDHKTHPDQKFILDICIPLERTGNLKIEKKNKVDFLDYKEQNKRGEKHLDYHQLIGYMKELRGFLHKEYSVNFKFGNLYQGSPDFSYFSFTTEELKKQKLKFVIVLNHQDLYFSICLSGQNKSIRKKYWEIFKGSDWDKYHLAESINESLSIIDHTIVKEPDFSNKKCLTEQIEKESFKFINEIRGILES